MPEKNKKQRNYRRGIAIVLFLALFSLTTILVRDYAYAQASKEEEALFVAQKAFEDGFYEVSLSLLERFLKNYPASNKAAEVQLLSGRCYFHQGKFLDALRKFEELLGQPASNNIQDEIYYWIAEVHFRGNNFSKAGLYYKKIIDDFPNSAYSAAAYYSLGWCFFQDNDFKQALDNFKLVEERFAGQPQVQDASFKIIECLYNLKDYSGLKEKVKAYLKIYSKDPVKLAYLYFYLAESDYYLNNFNDAIEEYSKVLSGSGNERIKALSGLGIGWSYLKLKRYQEAQDTFSKIKSEGLESKSQDVLLLAKGILAFETAKFSEAKDIYEALIKQTADPLIKAEGYLGRADALYNLSEYRQAINSYQEALVRISPDSGSRDIADKIHYGLAWSFLKEGEFKEAIKEFKNIVQYSQDSIIKVSALCQIGDAYQDSGDYARAQEAYDGILKDYPDSFYNDYVQYQLAITMIKASNYDGAILSLLSFKKNFPNSKLLDDVCYSLGLAYFQKQDYNLSRDTFLRFAEEFKDSRLRPQAMYLLGTSNYNLGRYQEAIEVFKNVIKLFSQDSELTQKAEYEIADCYYQMGNEKEAMARFKALRARYPDSKLTAEIMWWLGEYYYRNNDLSLARRYFNSLIQDFPKSDLIADAYYVLGSIFNEELNFTEAVRNFKKVIELSHSDLAGQAAIAIADIYVKDYKPDLAIKTYLEMIQKFPNLTNLIYPKLADTYFKAGEFTKAEEFYRKSLDLASFKDIADIQFRLAEALQAAGKKKEAVEEYLKVTYIYSENKGLVVKSFLRIAKIYEEEEAFKEAVNIYKKIIEMRPAEAKYAQERIDLIRAREK